MNKEELDILRKLLCKAIDEKLINCVWLDDPLLYPFQITTINTSIDGKKLILKNF